MVPPRVVLVDCGSKATSAINVELEAQHADVHVIPLNRENAQGVLDTIMTRDPGAIVISGSEDHLWQPGARTLPVAFLEYVVARRVPVLGICYGHQLLATLAGGTVVENPSGVESGDVQVEVLPGHEDFTLFHGLGPRFMAFMKHHDIVQDVPPCWINVASSALTGVAAMQLVVDGELLPVFGVQFHPELSRARVKRAVFGGLLAHARP